MAQDTRMLSYNRSRARQESHKLCRMKPTRVRMTHSLVMNYGLYKKMEIYVCPSAHTSPVRNTFSDHLD